MRTLQEAIYHFEGSVNKLSVDDKGVTLVAAMGLPPLAHQDDPVRGARAALEVVERRYGVTRVLVDSGGTLNGVLLRAGLVDEVSLLVHPCLVGGRARTSVFRPGAGDDAGVVLRLADLQQRAGDVVWLRYDVATPTRTSG